MLIRYLPYPCIASYMKSTESGEEFYRHVQCLLFINSKNNENLKYSQTVSISRILKLLFRPILMRTDTARNSVTSDFFWWLLFSTFQNFSWAVPEEWPVLSEIYTIVNEIDRPKRGYFKDKVILRFHLLRHVCIVPNGIWCCNKWTRTKEVSLS